MCFYIDNYQLRFQTILSCGRYDIATYGTSPKVGSTSGKKIKKCFYFAFRTICTTFGFAEGTDARQWKQKNQFFVSHCAHLFVPLTFGRR